MVTSSHATGDQLGNWTPFVGSFPVPDYCKQSKQSTMTKAIGTARSTDSNTKGQALRASSGSGMTFTKARGLGASMVADLDSVKRKATAQYRADRAAAARERLAERRTYSHLECAF